VFKGTYQHRIDAKGRLPVPAAFRRALQATGSRLVVTLLDQCLAAYPPEQWQQLEAQLRALPAFSTQVKALTRLLESRAADCELDVQGRILVPAPLRQAAGLRQDVIVVGVLDRFEVWSPEAWSAFLGESQRLLEDISLGVPWPALPASAPADPRSAPPPRRRRPQGKPKP
jgi:MraZ protein